VSSNGDWSLRPGSGSVPGSKLLQSAKANMMPANFLTILDAGWTAALFMLVKGQRLKGGCCSLKGGKKGTWKTNIVRGTKTSL